MKYNNKDIMYKKAVKLYLQGKSYKEIAEILGCSRNYASKLIKDDSNVKEKQNTKTLKLYKNRKRIELALIDNTLTKIGFSRSNINEYADIFIDEKNQQIIIKKHKE